MNLIFFIISAIFFAVNYLINKKDILAPGSIFCLITTIYSAFILAVANEYEITLHSQTILIFLVAFGIITILSAIFSLKYKNTDSETHPPKIIFVDDKFVLLICFLQLIVIIWNIVYLISNTSTYNIFNAIKIYDQISKFGDSSILTGRNIIYRLMASICYEASYLILYVYFNNLVALKKSNIYQLFAIILLIVQLILGGGRSSLFQVITMAIIIVYFSYIRSKSSRKKLKKFTRKYILYIAIFAIVIIATSNLVRDVGGLDLKNYVFLYTAGSIVNLDIFLQKYYITLFKGISTMFGRYTFTGVYSELSPYLNLTGVNNFSSINVFQYSPNGHLLGNVYTTFYAFIYDFGYFGVIPLFLIICLYYVPTYFKCKYKSSNTKFDFSLYIFAYLYNNFIMLEFSNRFYENVVNLHFLNFVIISWLIDSILIEKKFKIGRFRIVFNV